MRLNKRILSLILALVLSVTCLWACDKAEDSEPPKAEAPSDNTQIAELTITNGDSLKLTVGGTVKLRLNFPVDATWSSDGQCISVSDDGLVTATSTGVASVTAKYNNFTDTISIDVVPAVDVDNDEEKREFYDNYFPATSPEDAKNRTEQGLMSGNITVPDQAPTLSEYQPVREGKLIRNNEPYYVDEVTYVIVDAYGIEVMRIYKGGAYITLEEVAAYVYAFGDVPANYISGKNASPSSSIWGEYLRLNHSKFSGNTSKYPYEPVLPRISGCGGDLSYYEIDIGTTGTDCDPNYISKIYNNGQNITRGAARIVYTRYDRNGDNIIDPNEKFVFYTYNHYNDFQEYLNYFGGWGEMFGNVTGGGTLSSKTDYNPTPYVAVYMGKLSDGVARTVMYAYVEEKYFLSLISL